ncbi:MAG TPA: hypothetical protein GX717_00395, partial [Clostridiaceae bacterium]|nr:hypothetical protein [Clostridiaceae bacterium]
LLTLLLIINRTRKKLWLPFHAPLLGFLFFMALAMLAFVVGYLLYGTAGFKTFAVAMMGEINVIWLVALLALILLQLDRSTVKRTLATAFAVFMLITSALVLYQKINFVSAYRFMDVFYVSNYRFKPLFMMWKADGFDRVMGPFFTPILLGTTLLLVVAVLLAYLLSEARSWLSYFATGIILLATAIGILSFSKTYMLGVPLLFLVTLVLIFLIKEKRRERLTRLLGLFLLVVAVYALVYVSLPEHMDNIKHYYYDFLLKPFGALSSRYEGIAEPMVNQIAEDAPKAVNGIAKNAFAIFKEHPLFGVGPVPIRGEFLGDSQIIVTLHNGGIVASLAYLIFYIGNFVRSFINKDLTRMLIIIALGMGCVASMMLTLPSTLPFIALLIYLGESDCPIRNLANRRGSKNTERKSDEIQLTPGV